MGRRAGRLVAFLVCLGVGAKAGAWASPEHQEIGRVSYQRACEEVTTTVAARTSVSPGVRTRLDIVCGRNVAELAALYGDATAIAGDYLRHPADFLSRYGAWKFSSRKHYWLLAMENVQHFNPMATQSWAEYHQRALDHALSGAGAEGLASVESLQLAINESAFADHFLADSFASGHMGFNRTASSAAAAKTFHDSWNARGRVVSDRAGRRWVTYGDGRLDDQLDAQGRQHVVDASTISVRGVLSVYVLGERSPADELAAWQMLPFAIEAPELLPEVEEVVVGSATSSDRQLVPLMGTVRPARKDLIIGATVWSTAAFEDPGNALVVGVAHFELAVPRVPVQARLGAGATLREPNGGHTAVVDTGVLVPLGLSVEGLLSHQLNVTFSWVFRSAFAAIAHAEYQLNAELGDVIFSLQAGLAENLPELRTGWFGGLAVGLVFSAAGGGSF